MSRTNVYFFVVAFLLSLIDGFFKISSPEMDKIKFIFLVFLGILFGLFLISYQKDFLIAGTSFVLGILVVFSIFNIQSFSFILSKILFNLLIFITSAIITCSFKFFIETLIKIYGCEVEKHEGVTPEHLNENSFQRVWIIVILIAFGFALLQILFEIFYDVSSFRNYLMVLDGIITLIFCIDLVVLYKASSNFKFFITHYFIDIFAAIPLLTFFRIFKVFRSVKIVRIFNSSIHLSKFMKMNKSSKFFSKRIVLNNDEEIAKNIEIKSKSKKNKKSSKKKSLKGK